MATIQELKETKMQKTKTSWDINFKDIAGNEVKLSPAIIRTWLLPPDSKATDQEIVMFLKLCQYQKLNPFLREAYLIKYGTAAATIVTGKETFLKRANVDKRYKGHKVWTHDITLGTDGSITDMQATAEVYKDGYTVPVSVTVDYTEYVGKKSDGSLNKMWREKPRTMIKKVALVQALREAFPDNFAGMYSPEEITDVDMTSLPENTIPQPPEGQPVETEEPQEDQKPGIPASPAKGE